MGRSQLYKGRDTKYLTPAEAQLERLYDQIDRPGYRITPQQFYQTPQAMELMDRVFGGLEDRIPPGSQIVSQTPGKVTYRDAEGYEHNIIRRPDGQFTETTSRPSILPQSQAQQGTLDMLRKRVEQGLTGPVGIADIPPELQAQFDAISAAERGDIQQRAGEERGRLVSQLYGNRVNQSSFADEQAAKFTELLGRLYQQQAAGAAGRNIGMRQYLTDLIQRQGEGAAGLYGQLTGQGTQRDIAGAGLDLERARLGESSRQFGATNYLDQLRTQIEQRRLENENSPFNKFIKTLHAVGALAGGGGTAYSAYKGG